MVIIVFMNLNYKLHTTKEIEKKQNMQERHQKTN